MLVTCLWYLNCLETWLGSVEYFIETRLGLDKDNYSMKMFDFKMFWIANELIQREYDSFFFLFPFFGLVIIDLLFKNVKEARQGWLFYFWEKRRVAWLSSKPNTNVSLPVLQRIGKLSACLVHVFKHMFSVFKQYYTYFRTLFHPHVFPKNTNNITRTTLPNGLNCHHPEVWSINAIISAGWIALWVLPISYSNRICVCILKSSFRIQWTLWMRE